MDDWLRRLIEQQEQIRRMMEGPLRDFERNRASVERVARLFDTRLPDYAKQFAELDLKSRLPELGGISALTKETLDTMSMKGSVLEMQKYLDAHRETYAAMDRAALPYKAITDHLATISKYYGFTSSTLHGLDYERIGELVSASVFARDRLALATISLERRNANLIAGLSNPEGRVASAPPFATELPAAGLFLHARAVRTITPHEPGDPKTEQDSEAASVELSNTTVAFLETHLPLLNPMYLEQYRGVKARGRDRGPDWSTQGGASMRKLVKGVLHTVAPDHVVLPWARQNQKQLDPQGRPTRATKIDWLCAVYPLPLYTSTVKMELVATLRVLEMLNVSQHVDDTAEVAEQYDETVLRAEIAVMHILTVWKARNSN